MTRGTVRRSTELALSRWRARLAAPAIGDGVGTTAYRSGGLTLRSGEPEAAERVRAALEVLAAESGCRLEFGRSAVNLVAPDGPAPDAWTTLNRLRTAADPTVRAAVGLDHLMSMAEQVGGNPLALGHGRPGLDQYGVTGYAGRGPVAFTGPVPVNRHPGRRPRVVVLDTGIGEHPWFEEDPVVTRLQLHDRTVGPQVDPGSIKAADADGTGLVGDQMLGALGTHAGHGTFIAGLLRQTCPEAEIVALAVMGSDGIVPETTLTDALTAVLDKQRQDPGWADAVVMSLGYYPESLDDLTYTSALRDTLLSLARAGVAVFCAAGNDATDRPSFPAAFAADPQFAEDPDLVPLSSVAALNPDGSLADFSNYGSWVTAAELGVNLVSTAPIIADGSGRPAARAVGTGGRIRSAPDPDDFTSGFASWSGTSFAAPVLAGRYLQALLAAGLPENASQRRALLAGVNRLAESPGVR